MKRNKKDKKICILGLGYIGLPTACFLANAGYKVIGVDINKKKIQSLKNGQVPFYEPGLQKLFEKGFKNFEFALRPKQADVFIIAVPTPITKIKKADLSYVKEAAKGIHNVIKNKNLVIIESTIPPGCSKNIIIPIIAPLLRKQQKNIKLYLAHAPERAIPGKTLKEMVKNDRIIGGIDKQSAKLAKEIYSSFTEGKIYLTNATTAEFVKLIENAFRDVNIAFANELAKLCDEDKINVWEAIKLANLHPRVNIHSPGPGVGGHCLSTDPWFLIEKHSNGTRAIKMARRINDSMPNYVLSSISKMLNLNIVKKPRITVLGVAYKSDVDDWRETPALRVIELARKKGWKIKIHDPWVKNFPYVIEKSFKNATQNSDCLVVLANHSFYKYVDPEKIRNMRNKNIFDARCSIVEQKWKKSDFNVKILGKAFNLGYENKIYHKYF